MPSSDRRPAQSSFASLERTLDRAIGALASGTPTRETRALLIEARRLRSVIANWRSIPPPDLVRDEMVDRVLQLSAAVGAPPATYDDEGDREAREAAEQKARQQADTNKYPVQPKPPEEEEEDARAEAQQGAYAADETEAYSIDFEPRFYTFDSGSAVPTGGDPPYPPAQPAAPQPRGPAQRPAAKGVLPRPSITMDAAVTTLQADLQPLAKSSVARRSEPPPRAQSQPPPRAQSQPPPRAQSQPPPRTSERPSPVTPPERPPSVPPASIAVPPPSIAMPAPSIALREERASPMPRQTPTPDRPPSVPPASLAVATYSYEGDADDLAVPRTQIVASPTRMADPPDPLLTMLVDPLSSRADAYRAIRRKLSSGSGARVLGVTSAERGEGKTVCSLNLALALRDGAKGGVLVVDANPLAPGVAKLLGVAPQDCFLAQLARHADDPRAPWAVAEPLPRLHVLAIDPQQQHPPRLDATTFSQGMERLKQAGYEYIVVDAPHVLGSGSANVIADAVDALILTALPMKSVRRQMRKAVEQIEPAPILGVVVLEG